MLYKQVPSFNPAFHIILKIEKGFDLEKLSVYESYLYSTGVVSVFMNYSILYNWFEIELNQKGHFYLTNFIINSENEIIISKKLLNNTRDCLDQYFCNSTDIKDYAFNLSNWDYEQFMNRFLKTGEIIKSINEVNKEIIPKMYL